VIAATLILKREVLLYNKVGFDRREESNMVQACSRSKFQGVQNQ